MADRIKGLTVEVDGTVVGLKKAITEATSDLRSLEKSLKSVNKEIEFNPDNTDAYLRKQETLQETLVETTRVLKKLNEYKDQLDNVTGLDKTDAEYNELTKKIAECTKKQKEFVEQLNNTPGAIDAFKTKAQNLNSELDALNKKYKEINNGLKLNPDSIELLSEKQKTLNEIIGKTADALEYLQTQQVLMDANPTVDKQGEAYRDMELKIAQCTSNLQQYNNELSDTENAFKNASSGLDAYVKKIDSISQTINTTIASINTLSRAFQFLTTTSVKSAVDYEKNIASIKKVITDLSDETVEDLKNVAVETGNAFENISTVASLGATLGIAQKDIASFTKTMIDLNTATDGAISFDEGSKSVARFLNVMGIGTDEASNFGSALTYVGDQFAATADEVLEVSSRMAGLSTIAGVSQYDLIGLAAEMKNIGLSSESASSAMTRVFMTINTKVSTGSKDLVDFAKVAGMSAKDFAKAWEEDATDAFLYFVDGLDKSMINEISDAIENNTNAVDEYAEALGMSKDKFIEAFNEDAEGMIDKYVDSLADLSDESESASSVLTDLKLTNVRTAETLLKLAGNGDIVREAISDASDAWEKNTALTDKANTVYETTASRYQALTEKARQVISTLATDALPVLEKLMDWGIEILDVLDSMPQPLKNILATFIAFGAASAPILKVTSSVLDLDKNLKILSTTGGTHLQNAIGKLTTSLGAGNGLIGVLSTALPVAIGVAGAAFLAYEGYVKSGLKETIELNNKLKELDETAQSNLVESIKSVNAEMREAEIAIENINEAQDGLTFINQNGKQSVDTTTDAYKKLNDAVQNLNDSIGGANGLTYYIDENTGKIVDQNGAAVDLAQTLNNVADAKLREAWLSSNSDKYIEYLELQNKKFDELIDKGKELEDIRSAATKDTTYTDVQIDWYEKCIEGLIDINDLSQEEYNTFLQMFHSFGDAHSEYNEALTEYGNKLKDFEKYDGFTEIFEQLKAGNITWDEAITKINDYEAAVEEAENSERSLIQQTKQENQKNIEDLNKELASLSYASKATKEDVLAERAEIVGQILSAKDDIYSLEESATDSYSKLWRYFKVMYPDVYNAIKNPFTDAITGVNGAIDSFKMTEAEYETMWQNIKSQYPEIYEAMYKPYADAIDAINAKKIENKSATWSVTVRQNVEWTNGSSTKPSTRYSATTKSGGFFGDVLSKIPTIKIDPIADSIRKTIGNARQVQSKFASGGYSNEIALNASFTINNNGHNVTQSLAKQMAKQVADYVNEELGKAM